jgi:hypothetical protein
MLIIPKFKLFFAGYKYISKSLCMLAERKFKSKFRYFMNLPKTTPNYILDTLIGNLF